MGETDTRKTAPGGLDAALRRAREMEAAHHDAVLVVREAEILRLEALRDDLLPAVASNERARAFFDLTVVPGEPPRLWIDLVTYVIMAPGPRSYRLTMDLPSGREVLFESGDRAAMAERIKQHMAHRLVVREREMAGAKVPGRAIRRFSSWALWGAAIIGFALGAGAFMIALIILKKLPF